MRYVESFEDFTNLNQVFYSMDTDINLSKFIEKYVYNKQKFKLDEIERWQKKYNLELNDRLLWVTTKKKYAYRFYDDPKKMIYKYSFSDGFIIPESKDKYCYIMVLRDIYDSKVSDTLSL